MKKIIIITAVMIFTVTMGIVEYVTSMKTYKEIENYASEIEKRLENEVGTVSDDVVKISEDMEDTWHKYRSVALVMSNHQVIKNITDKIVALESYVKMGNVTESYVTASQVRHMVADMQKENVLSLGNLL